MRALLLLVFIQSWVLSLVSSTACRRHSDCDDNIPCTLDYCYTIFNGCYNLPKKGEGATCKGNVEPTDLESIMAIAEQNPISIEDRVHIAEALQLYLGELHSNRPVYLNRTGNDPLPELQKLQENVQNYSTVGFHQEVIRIFNLIDDRHTTYKSPSPLRQSVALIPFTMQEYYASPEEEVKILISEIAVDADMEHLEVGTEIVSWNGVPILEAVKIRGELGFGTKDSVRFVRGLRRLTMRELSSHLIPEEDEVVVGFKNRYGEYQKTTICWLYASLPLPVALAQQGLIFNNSILSEFQPPGVGLTTLPGRRIIPVIPSQRIHLSAEVVNTTNGEVGVLKMFDFTVANATEWFGEVVRLIFSMPLTGLVIDVRRNRGGRGEVCQIVSQLFTTNKISPVQIRLRNTEKLAAISARFPNPLEANTTRIARIQNEMLAAQNGAEYLPSYDAGITPLANSFPALSYPAPVVLLTDAETYSCGETIVANFIENGVGIIVGVDETTGGGAAVPLNNIQISTLLPEFPILNLPPSVYLRTASVQITYNNTEERETWEWEGIPPKMRYYRTKQDIIEEDNDLFEYIAKLLYSPMV